MQTSYNRASEIINLAAFRRRQTPAQRDSLARRSKEERWCPVVLTCTPEERRRARRERQAWYLEIGSSVAVILTVAVFTLRMLI